MVRALAMLSVMLAVAIGCGSPTKPAPAPPSKADEPGAIIGVDELSSIDPPLRDATSWAKRVTYTSRSGVNDAYTHVTESIFVPIGNPPEGGFPIVALGHEITGTTPDCAPSLSPKLFNTSSTVEELLKAGYVVTVPDYQGLGNPSDGTHLYHPYLDSTTAGYNMIDSVRAARALLPQTSPWWAALGIRQGGQAAWAANELADNYGYGMKLVGTASISPMADIQGLADAAEAGSLTTDQKPVLMAFLAALHNEYGNDINLDNYRRGAAERYWNDLLGCQNRTPAERADMAAQISADDLRPANPGAVATLRSYLAKTTLPQGPAQAPMLVIYGGQDSLIPPAWTDSALGRACAMGDTIQIDFRRDAGPINPTDALGWIGDRFKSVPAPNDCGSLTPS